MPMLPVQAAPQTRVAMKSDLKISGPKDAGKTTNWVQLSAVAVTVCLAAALYSSELTALL